MLSTRSAFDPFPSWDVCDSPELIEKESGDKSSNAEDVERLSERPERE
jgi:hypothetical protein